MVGYHQLAGGMTSLSGVMSLNVSSGTFEQVLHDHLAAFLSINDKAVDITNPEVHS